MILRHNAPLVLTISLCLLFVASVSAHAGTPISDRVAVEAGVKAEVTKDLALSYNPLDGLSGRTCLDGRPVADFQGDIVEYWANLECTYCGIQEPVHAQRNNPNMCIVVRHIPSGEYGESLKKALSYEALKSFSINAANLFWDSVVPKTVLGIPVPYEAALLRVFQEAAIAPEQFSEKLTKEASELVSNDIFMAQGRISTTPTYILAGIRFPACDFTATELSQALKLAIQARDGDQDAVDKIIKMITNGLMNEKLI